MSSINSLGANTGIQNTQQKASQKLSQSKSEHAASAPAQNHPAPPTSNKLDKTV